MRFMHWPGSRLRRILIECTLPEGTPRTPSLARGVLRECAALRTFPLEQWHGPFDHHDGRWRMDYVSPVDRNGWPMGPKERYPYKRNSSIEVSRDGKMAAVLYLRER